MSQLHRHWIWYFAATIVALACVAFFAALRLPGLREPALNFYALAPDAYVDTSGLTRRQSGSLKLGFAESYPAPLVGAYGNHIINFFGADAFGAYDRPGVFFNYSYANLSLPETLRFLRHLELRDRLPSKLIIVAITPPHADNGRFIIDHGNELPADVLLDSAWQSGDLAEISDALWQSVEFRLHEVFNYNTLVLGLLRDVKEARITGPFACRQGRTSAQPGWTAALPAPLRKILQPSPDPCDRASWEWTLRRDGATNLPNEATIVRDEDGVGAADRGLRAGDEVKIVRLLRAIDAVGRRRGARVVFLVPPVYESDRSGSVVNQVFSRAMHMAPDLTIIDDRGLRNDRALFVDYRHANGAYFRQLAQRLAQRGLWSDAFAQEASPRR